MSDSINPTLNRRTFIRGAAGVVGASALTQTGLAGVLAPASEISVAFFDGTRLVPADRIVGSERGIERVEIDLDSRGSGTLRGVVAKFPVRFQKAIKKAAFNAWEPGGRRRRFEMPVDRKSGLGFTVTQGTAKSEGSVEFQLGGTGGLNLREGTYVIAAGKVNWNSFRFEGDSVNGPLLAAGGRPTSLQYVLLTIERV